jgi:hypothetical protein
MSWRDRAFDQMRVLAAPKEDFTSDDLLEVVGVPDETNAPNAVNNQIGTVFKQAARMGMIVFTGRVVPSKRPTRHGSMIKVWRGK